MYRRKIIVLPSETACTNEMKIHALLNRLQDTAGMAVGGTEGAPAELMRRGYGWVLLKYDLEVLTRLPGMNESLIIETRHTAGDGFHILRAFRVFREADEAETLVLAKTSWVLIDLAAGHPVRAAQHLPEVFADVSGDPPIDGEFTAIPRLSGARLRDEPVLGETAFPVRFHDLDANGHVNNAVYFEWAWEATPLDPAGWSVREMHAEFRVSAKLGETVVVRVKALPANGGTRAFVYDMAEEGRDAARPLARFSSVWVPLGEWL
ncbi:MAG: hypothetical protein LBC93_02930 [Synergistaceae bacterium]|nr:hypothetical protein [Synergistaceae bacterium]